MASRDQDFGSGDDVIISGGAYAGESATVVGREGDLVTVELSIAGQPTRIAFDASALVRPNDPRSPLRAELERRYQDAAREDMIRWFAARDANEDAIEIDELGMLYQIASPVRREYLAILDEFAAVFSDAALANAGPAAAERVWRERREDWFSRLAVATVERADRERALALMDRVRKAVPPPDDSN